MLECPAFWSTEAAPITRTTLLSTVANTPLFCNLLETKDAPRAGKSADGSRSFPFIPLHVESVAWVAERKDVLSHVWGSKPAAYGVLYSKVQLGELRFGRCTPFA